MSWLAGKGGKSMTCHVRGPIQHLARDCAPPGGRGAPPENALLTATVDYVDSIEFNPQGQLYFAEATEQRPYVVIEQDMEQYNNHQ
eukprot:9125698-Pyramimonas_sp.AAC.1